LKENPGSFDDSNDSAKVRELRFVVFDFTILFRSFLPVND